MDMSVSATGSSALREYQKQTAAGASAAFPEAAQQTLSAPTNGTPASSLPGFRKLSNEEEAAFAATFGLESLDHNKLNDSVTAMLKQMLETQEYDQFTMDQVKEKMQMQNEFFTKMRGWLGGPETAMAVPNDPLGPEPVRTSSGGIHPQSERIKEYIRTHKDEWDSAHSLKLPSFDEWQKTRG